MLTSPQARKPPSSEPLESERPRPPQDKTKKKRVRPPHRPANGPTKRSGRSAKTHSPPTTTAHPQSWQPKTDRPTDTKKQARHPPTHRSDLKISNERISTTPTRISPSAADTRTQGGTHFPPCMHAWCHGGHPVPPVPAATGRQISLRETHAHHASQRTRPPPTCPD